MVKESFGTWFRKAGVKACRERFRSYFRCDEAERDCFIDGGGGSTITVSDLIRHFSMLLYLKELIYQQIYQQISPRTRRALATP